jgi:acetyltransferase-like isoleucine patch superfamily enzyme
MHSRPDAVQEWLTYPALADDSCRSRRQKGKLGTMSASSPPADSPTQAVHVPVGRDWHIRLAIVRAVLSVLPAFSLNRCRLLALKACGIRVGQSTWFGGVPRLTGPGSITSRLQIGSACGFNDGCEFDLKAPITIGNHVAVGHEVRFLTTLSLGNGNTAAPITVGDGVWLGARCTIQGGVTVGAGSVIGAGVNVASNVPPNTLLTGAKPVSLAKWR